MTELSKADFKKCMQQGLGRCALVLKSSSDVDRYKETVLWGCLHNLSFDTQCEGTRADYIYQLTTYFEDVDYFLLPTVEAFAKTPRSDGWLFSHLAELLGRFAENGSASAEEALKQKYRELFSRLLAKKSFRSYDFERDNFERVCLTLSTLGGTEALLEMAQDMGKLFKENPHYSGSDFDWFCASMDQGIGKKKLHGLLKRAAKSSEYMAVFYKNYVESTEEMASAVRKPIATPDAEALKEELAQTEKLSVSAKVRFSRQAATEKQRLAEEAIAEPDLDKKAELLSVFTYGDDGFPLSHETLIAYSKSSHERLREVSLEILTLCQSEEVRECALELLTEEKYKSLALKMLISNYTPADKEWLLLVLNGMKVDYTESTDWHSIGMHILGAKDRGVKLPKEFFLYIYNNTLCSCCREYAVLALSKHRWLTSDIIEECRFDSNGEISAYINRHYPLK